MAVAPSEGTTAGLGCSPGCGPTVRVAAPEAADPAHPREAMPRVRHKRGVFFRPSASLQAAIDCFVGAVIPGLDYKGVCDFMLSTFTDGRVPGVSAGNGVGGSCAKANPVVVANDPSGQAISATCTDPPLSTCPNLF